MAANAAAVQSAGEKIYRAVRGLDDGIDRMSAEMTWSGRAHTAAAGMFDRATDRASAFKSYTDEVADRLQRGGATIAGYRTRLLTLASEIDAGPLNVTDQWVVFIDQAGMTAERAAELEAQARAAQTDLNPLLVGLDEADSDTGTALLATQATEGISPDLPGPIPVSLAPHPSDEVPSPGTEDGRQFQEIARAQDMASTVRGIDEKSDRDGNRITIYTMLDGSTHEVTEYVDQGLPSQQIYPPGTTRVLHTDKNGNWISQTTTTPAEDGGMKTEVWWADGTGIVMSETADGVRAGSCITADGREGILPDQFFTDPLPTLAGGALSGLQSQAERGIPGLTAGELDKIKVGAKFGGPALGLATMAYNVVSAETLRDACVSGVSGAFSTVGGIATAGVGGAMAGPLGAFGGALGGAWAFGYVGAVVGEVLCPR